MVRQKTAFGVGCLVAVACTSTATAPSGALDAGAVPSLEAGVEASVEDAGRSTAPVDALDASTSPQVVTIDTGADSGVSDAGEASFSWNLPPGFRSLRCRKTTQCLRPK